MADQILRGQQQYSTKFINPILQKTGRKLDDYFPEAPSTTVPGVWKKMSTTAVGTAAAGQANQFVIGNGIGFLGDMYLELVFAQTSTGTYSSFPALQAITNVQVQHGSNELHNYNYRAAMSYLMNNLWPNEEKARFQTASGGSTPGGSASVTCYAPIPTFWSSWKHAENDFQPPLPLLHTKSALTVNITLDTIADLLAASSTGGGLTSARLVYWVFETAESEVQNVRSLMDAGGFTYFGVDWDTAAWSGTTVATGTTGSTIDLSGFSGDLRGLIVSNKLASDLTTAHNYFIEKSLDSASLKIDGVEVYKFSSANEGLIDQLAFNGSKKGSDATLGVCYVINFAHRADEHCWNGALPMDCCRKLTLDVTHSLGANATCQVAAVCNRWYVSDSGIFKRAK